MARILIAEDERDIRDLIEITLKFAGHEVHKVANGAEAVEKAPELLPDLIMMDVRMPRMSGYEACVALKNIDSIKDIPIVFLSAKGQDAEIEAGLDVGAEFEWTGPVGRWSKQRSRSGRESADVTSRSWTSLHDSA